MKITNDVLKVLKIESIYIQHKKETRYCFVKEIKNKSWEIVCDTELHARKAVLKIKFNSSFVYFDISLKKTGNEKDYFCYHIKIQNENPDDFQNAFLLTLENFEKKEAEWNKRSEVRYPIGLDDNKVNSFNLNGLEQKVLTEEDELVCIVNNISFSGMQIIAPDGNFKKEQLIGIALNFKNPFEKITLLGRIKNVLLKKLNNNMYAAVVSLKFEKPSVDYRERVSSYITLINNEIKSEEKK